MSDAPFVIVGRQRSPFGSVNVGATHHRDPNCSHLKDQRGGRQVLLAHLPFELNTRPCMFCAAEDRVDAQPAPSRSTGDPTP